MSDALEKNKASLFRLFGNAELVSRVQFCRIGIWTDALSKGVSATLLAEALGDVLTRFWLTIDVAGPLADVFLAAARIAAESGGLPSTLSAQWKPPYDFVVAIGTSLPGPVQPGLQVGAAGWQAVLGKSARVNDDPNPVGPTAAAAIAASEVFKVLFKDVLGDRLGLLLKEYVWSAWEYGRDGHEPKMQPLHFADAAFFGVGAVTHGLLWVLERWPESVTGAVDLVDPDHYEQSNGQRYAGKTKAVI